MYIPKPEKMLCVDLLREISKYLLVSDCLNMEIVFREKMYDIEDYKMRLQYQIFTLQAGVFTVRGFYNENFRCEIKTKERWICTVSMYKVNSTKDACEQAIELFKLRS